MHGVTGTVHGWNRDNYIGTSPQINTQHENWHVFWRDCRLKPQLESARIKGYSTLFETGNRLLEVVGQLLDGHQPEDSLLHGDLWSGNAAFTPDGQPVIFDPASYYGDRETDIAMTELFGGFGPAFYSAYRTHAPLAAGYRIRHDLYNLYHLLNHLNLFGSAYLSRSENLIGMLISEVV
jgi:fructosamine-3-kinase